MGAVLHKFATFRKRRRRGRYGAPDRNAADHGGDLSLHTIVGVGAAIDTILDFTTIDLLQVGGIAAIDLVLSSYHVQNGNGTFLLGDGSKVVLDGYTQPLNM